MKITILLFLIIIGISSRFLFGVEAPCDSLCRGGCAGGCGFADDYDIKEVIRNHTRYKRRRNRTISTNLTGILISVEEEYYEYEDENVMLEKQGLFPITMREFFATGIICIASAFLSAGGVGGSGIYIPTLMLVAGYSMIVSLPISSMIVFGSFFSCLLFLVWESHPNPKVNGPIIDYNLAAIAQPNMLAGSVIGVLLNIIFPSWLTLILMVVVLFYSSGDIMLRGIKEAINYFGNKEDESTCSCTGGMGKTTFESEESKEESSDLSSEISSSATTETDVTTATYTSSSSIPSSTEEEDLEKSDDDGRFIRNLILYENFRIQPIQLMLFFFLQIFITAFSYLRGSSNRVSFIGVDVCGDTWYWYWVITAVMIIVSTLIAYLVSFFLYSIHKAKERSPHYKFQKGVFLWDKKNAFLLPIVFVFVGMFSSLTGICGCMLLSPLFLRIGVIPGVGCATSTILTLFTTASTVIQYIFMGRVQWDYALYYGLAAFFSSAIGRIVISYPVSKLKMRFVLTIIVSLLILFGTINIALLQGYYLYEDYKDGDYSRFWFSWIC